MIFLNEMVYKKKSYQPNKLEFKLLLFTVLQQSHLTNDITVVHIIQNITANFF